MVLTTVSGRPKARRRSCTIVSLVAGTLLVALSLRFMGTRHSSRSDWQIYAKPRWDLYAAAQAVLPPPVSRLGSEAVVEQSLILQESTRLTATQHSATIAEVSHGELLAAWFGGSWERNPDVAIYASRYRTSTGWGDPLLVATDPAGSEPCWNPVLVHLPASSQTILFFKVGSSPRVWRPFLKRSFDGGRTWQPAEAMASPCMGPAKNKPLVLPDGRTLLAGASDEVTSEMVTLAEAGRTAQKGWQTNEAHLGPKRHLVEGWRSWVEVSTDSGYTWHREKEIQYQGRVIQPALFMTSRSKARPYGMLLRPHKSGDAVSSFSVDGTHWSEARGIPELPNPNSGLDAVGLQDGRVIVVYNPVDRGVNGTGRHELAVATSDDSGTSWRKVLTLENSPEERRLPEICCLAAKDRSACMEAGRRRAEFSYPAVIQSSDGLVHVVYTYSYGASKGPCAGRENIKHVIVDPSMLE